MNERTRITLTIIVMAVILFTWQPLIHRVERLTGWELLPKDPVATDNTATSQPATGQMTTGPSYSASGTALVPTTYPAGGAPAGTAIMAAPATQPGVFSIANPTTLPANITLGSAEPKDPNYALQLDVSPVGGSLAAVVLNEYTQHVDSPDRFTFDTPYGDGVATLATRSVTINGAVQDISRSVWNVAQKGEGFVTLGLDITDGKNALLTLYKRFTVRPRNAGDSAGALGYDTELVCEFVNHTDKAMTVSTALVGPTYPPSESARGGDRQVLVGFQGKNAVVLSHDTLEGFTASAPSKQYSILDNQPLLWFGAGGNYFNAIIRPVGGMWIKQGTATLVNPAEADAALREVVLGIETKDIDVAPNSAQMITADVFFGPRLRSLLKNKYYAAPGIEFYHSLEIGGSCAFCTFQWLVDLLMSLLSAFHYVLRDWGLSIIVLVFIVRACLHPITKRSQINMAKMTKLGPEMEKLKKKYADDKEGLNKAMMQFYKNQGAAPVLGCLPMFLQMPIWIALYSGLSSTFELRQAPFLRLFGHNLTWIQDLSKPDHLFQFAQPFNFFFVHIDGINIIPILMAGAFFMQQKLTPKPPATTPEQQQQQKMMQWMTLLFPIMLYASPAGLNMYIFTSTCFGIIESRIIRKHIAEREALQPSGPTFVDGEIVRKELPGPKNAQAKKGGFMSWFSSLQEKAEQIRADAEKKAQQQKYKK